MDGDLQNDPEGPSLKAALMNGALLLGKQEHRVAKQLVQSHTASQEAIQKSCLILLLKRKTNSYGAPVPASLWILPGTLSC